MDNLKEIHLGGDYESAFESESEAEQREKRNNSGGVGNEINAQTSVIPHSVSKASKEVFHEEWSREEGRNQRFHLLALDAYSRHKKLINEYILCYPGATSMMKRDTQKDKNENDVLIANHKFLWSNDDKVETWEQRLAKKYYDKLFKEYCIVDLSRYRENKIAMRWRIESEVVSGKGQFICGNKRCKEPEGLKSWEVNFAYSEDGEKKNALVKVRACPECSYKLNYKSQRKEIRKGKRKKSSDSTETIKKRKGSVNEEEKGQSSKVQDDLDEKDEPKDTEEIWKEPLKTIEERSKDEEFEDYLADMLL